jgi:hypothetical protein
MRGPVGQASIGRAIEQILIQEQVHPDRNSQDALGVQPGRRRGDDDAGMGGTRAGRPIATTADDPAMGPDIDLEDDRILGAREVVEGLATARTAALLRGELVVLDHSREVGMIAPLGPLLTALLTALSAGRRRAGVRGRVGRFGGGAGLGLSAEELLLAEAQQRLKPVDFGLELRLAFEGAAMHGPPVGGLPPGLELLLQAWANRAGALRDRRSGADRTGRRLGRSARGTESVQFRDRDPCGSEAKNGGRAIIHKGRV